MIFSVQFDSLQELFWMNGHGPYVWGAYAVATVAVAFLIWAPLVRRKRLLRELRAAVRRQQAQGSAGTAASDALTGAADT